MPNAEKVSMYFVQYCNFSLEHLQTTDSEHAQIDSHIFHKLVNWLMLWERINAKPLG